ncbi:unnamed protein product [Urochloa humidicola]
MSASCTSPDLDPEQELLPMDSSSSDSDDDMDDPFIATHLQIYYADNEERRRPFAVLPATAVSVPWIGIGGAGAAQRPAPAASIDALPTVEVSEPGVVCAICKEDLPVGTAARRLPCGHLYDSSCIVAWLEVHNSCPVCRSRLPSNPIVPPTVSSDQLPAPAGC